MPLPCPHCELDMEDEARTLYFERSFGPLFEMGCPWCNRAVTIELNENTGELRSDRIRGRAL